MLRSTIISAAMHLALVLVLLTMAVIQPPTMPRRKRIDVRIVTRQPKSEPRPEATPKPVNTPAPTPPPKTPRPTPKPKATPKPKQPTPKPIVKSTPKPPKKADAPKKEIVKEYQLVEATPTPTPTPLPTPRVTPRQTPRPTPTPRRTPREMPRPTPKPTPRPSVIVELPKPPKSATVDVERVKRAKVPVSIDESWAGLGENYNRMALQNISRQFKPPFNRVGVQCVVQFKIFRNGEIRDIEVIRSTGRNDLDNAARKALINTGRLQPLYDGIPGMFKQVQVSFDFQKPR